MKGRERVVDFEEEAAGHASGNNRVGGGPDRIALHPGTHQAMGAQIADGAWDRKTDLQLLDPYIVDKESANRFH